jgi:hypothetical protein
MMLVCFLVLGACSSPAPPAPTVAPTAAPTPTPTPANFGRFDIDLAMDHVRAIGVDIGRREAGSEGDARTATYIKERIERLGWTATEQRFPLPQGGESANVIGTPPGFDESQPYLLVGGHRDSHNGPGVNDNATGVAAALDVVRAIDEVPADIPVRFIAFGAEELQPLAGSHSRVGSSAFVEAMSEEAKANLVALVNLDMVGHGSPLVCARRTIGPREGTKRCIAEAAKLKIAAVERELPDWSDHGPFADAGLNTAWLWTGDVKCCYDNPRDTIDNVVPEDLERTGKVALAVVRSYEPVAS